MNNNSIYCLLERDSSVRYFGITNKKPEERLAEHLAESQRGGFQSKKTAWINRCLQSGIKIGVRLIKNNLSKHDAFRLERLLVRVFASAFNLVNSTHSKRNPKRIYSKCSPSKRRHLIWLRRASAIGDWYRVTVINVLSNKRTRSTIYRLNGLVRTSDGQSARQFCRGREQLLTKSAVLEYD